jgi:hypothetical protein
VADGAAVTGRVHGAELVVGRERGAEGPQAGSGLGEPVDDHDPVRRAGGVGPGAALGEPPGTAVELHFGPHGRTP